ncbi:MAG: hypothetical protein EXR64_04450 [Dehalococcoidia bacterium]|nr:hypothetical protein [Dehalococcoidia bacterium]
MLDLTLRQIANYGILVAFLVGSVGVIGNGVVESRNGLGHAVLRWMRNLGLFVAWGFIVVRAFT